MLEKEGMQLSGLSSLFTSTFHDISENEEQRAQRRQSKAILKSNSILTSQRSFLKEALLREEQWGVTESDDDTEAPRTSELKFKEDKPKRTAAYVFENGTIVYL